jgi:GNAT superfamily N-acetyltransferase
MEGPLSVLRGGADTFRIERAVAADVTDIVALLRDDRLGAARESADLERYLAAFAIIDRDPAHLLTVVRDTDGRVVGTMQLSLVPALTRSATTRLQIEGVRVAASARGAGLGSAMLEWAERYGRQHGAGLAQLTTDKTRRDAHRVYERLGYIATHEGLKKLL